eukprot:CAMPEP_0179379348 /NCGR_PEP_ID=MMETSP0797-20121207/89793_1 /TAXON_ID=47934 /ORGANISM="Dinophysis acuminata, Strain DAEP01" /LENGTH=69 /DNA_ID=CAMNT_0021095425 /DNA_START=242 /DNA_END=451 /DNA_ORIENTATION=-
MALPMWIRSLSSALAIEASSALAAPSGSSGAIFRMASIWDRSAVSGTSWSSFLSAGANPLCTNPRLVMA